MQMYNFSNLFNSTCRRDAHETQSCAIMRNNILGGYLLQEDAAAVNLSSAKTAAGVGGTLRLY